MLPVPQDHESRKLNPSGSARRSPRATSTSSAKGSASSPRRWWRPRSPSWPASRTASATRGAGLPVGTG